MKRNFLNSIVFVAVVLGSYSCGQSQESATGLSSTEQSLTPEISSASLSDSSEDSESSERYVVTPARNSKRYACVAGKGQKFPIEMSKEVFGKLYIPEKDSMDKYGANWVEAKIGLAIFLPYFFYDVAIADVYANAKARDRIRGWKYGEETKQMLVAHLRVLNNDSELRERLAELGISRDEVKAALKAAKKVNGKNPEVTDPALKNFLAKYRKILGLELQDDWELQQSARDFSVKAKFVKSLKKKLGKAIKFRSFFNNPKVFASRTAGWAGVFLASYYFIPRYRDFFHKKALSLVEYRLNTINNLDLETIKSDNDFVLCNWVSTL